MALSAALVGMLFYFGIVGAMCRNAVVVYVLIINHKHCSQQIQSFIEEQDLGRAECAP